MKSIVIVLRKVGIHAWNCAPAGIRTPNLLIRRYERCNKTPFIGGFHALIITVNDSVSITLFHERDSLNDSLMYLCFSSLIETENLTKTPL